MNIGVIYLIIMAFCASSYTAAQKLSSQYFSPVLAMLVSNIVVFILVTIIFLIQKSSGQHFIFSVKNIFFPILIGICATGIEFFGVLAFSKKIPLTIAPVITGSLGVLLTVIYGRFIFQEGVTPLRIAALVLSAISTFLVSISLK